MFASEWSVRCLPFDAAAAAHCALVRAQRVRSGRPITTEDAQIAAIALANRLPLVTRNTKDFECIDQLTVIALFRAYEHQDRAFLNHIQPAFDAEGGVLHGLYLKDR